MCPQEIATEVSITYLVVAGKRLIVNVCKWESLTFHPSLLVPQPFLQLATTLKSQWQESNTHYEFTKTWASAASSKTQRSCSKHKPTERPEALITPIPFSPDSDMLTGWLLRSLSLAFWTPKSRSLPPPPTPAPLRPQARSIPGGTWSPAWQQLRVDAWHFWVGAAGLWSHKGYLGGPQAVTMAIISQYTQLLHVETFSIA